VIQDAGSTDGTQELIRERLGHLPGELIEGSGMDLDLARTQALERVDRRADYILMLDPEDILLAPQGFTFPFLTAEMYSMHYRTPEKEPCPGKHRTNLVSTALPWHYDQGLRGPSGTPEGMRPVPLEDPIVLAPCGTCGRDPVECRRRTRLLELALREDPHNDGARFRLALYYRAAGRLEEALAAFQRRANLGTRDEEGWMALLEAARIQERLGRPDNAVVQAYLEAFERQPSRAEPLHYLARFLRLRGNSLKPGEVISQ
jgi:tetratricopeptide (TPR) repeat protein